MPPTKLGLDSVFRLLVLWPAQTLRLTLKLLVTGLTPLPKDDAAVVFLHRECPPGGGSWMDAMAAAAAGGAPVPTTPHLRALIIGALYFSEPVRELFFADTPVMKDVFHARPPSRAQLERFIPALNGMLGRWLSGRWTAEEFVVACTNLWTTGVPPGEEG